MEKYTIRDFGRDFPDDDACLEWLKNFLYPDGIYCEQCGRITKHHKVASRRSYSCDYCGHHVHPTAGTIYEKTTTPLQLWFHATLLMASSHCGISAKRLQRETGVTYKTAWRMFTQIRKLLQENDVTLSGTVEVDETYVGGRRPGKRSRAAAAETIVGGAVERKGRMVAKVIPDVSAAPCYP